MLVFFSHSQRKTFVEGAHINHLSVILKVYIKGDGKKLPVIWSHVLCL